ncbi:MAG: ATP-binding cassette domain-containing protein [Candidatus Thermoplasmatota archaeon]|jgi:fluoroquinolone transport system ATP-binding protein|nr:ATP-binding cassette domain-containing protein [Candidatus Thermoplasmatota archaeon]
MITKTIACPNCKTVVTVQANPGERIELVCPRCNTKGFFRFPEEQPITQLGVDEYPIKVQNLEFTYPKSKKKAVDGISFQIRKGEIFGFLGPNGAGKSTTQKVIIGLLKGYNGDVELFGKNLRNWGSDLYNNIGVCFELPNHYQKLTALENLELFSSFYKVKTVDPYELLKMVDLDKDANQRVGSFSKGMRTKLNFVRALLNNPRMLFLDEPTTGLDPVSARQVKNIILQKKKEGVSIFLTTHNMIDADELCDRVGFMVDGRLSLIASPKELKLKHGKKLVRVEYLEDGNLLCEEFNLANLGTNNMFINLLNSGRVQTIHTEEATLEDVFIKVTGRQLK